MLPQEEQLLEITVDSGAGESVAAQKHFPQSPLVDSPGSLAGQKYLGPAGEEIPNLGQMTTSMTIFYESTLFLLQKLQTFALSVLLFLKKMFFFRNLFPENFALFWKLLQLIFFFENNNPGRKNNPEKIKVIPKVFCLLINYMSALR